MFKFDRQPKAKRSRPMKVLLALLASLVAMFLFLAYQRADRIDNEPMEGGLSGRQGKEDLLEILKVTYSVKITATFRDRKGRYSAERTLELPASNRAFQEFAAIIRRSRLEGPPLNTGIGADVIFKGHPPPNPKFHGEDNYSDDVWMHEPGKPAYSGWSYGGGYIRQVSPKGYGQPIYPDGLDGWIRKTMRFEG